MAGGALGGLTLGAVLAAVSVVLGFAPDVQLGLSVGVVVVAAVAALARRMPWWVPQRTCQVSGNRLVAQHITSASFGWGFDLGVGVRTFVVTPAFYAVLALGIAAPGPFFSLILGTTYGCVRALTIAGFSRVVRRQLLRGCEAAEPGLGLAKQLRVAISLGTLLAAAFAVQWRV